MTTLNDFTFNYGFRKTMQIEFAGESTKIEVVLDAFKGEEITNEQKDAYELYLAQQAKYNQKALQLIKQYIDENNIEDETVEVKTLYIQRDGSFALLCECEWEEENGIAVILNPNGKVTLQDNFL